MDRRNFMRMLSAGGAGAAMPALQPTAARAAVSFHVVVVGGGMAGASVAKYLRYWGARLGIDARVTLVDQNASYVSCIMSNKVLTGESSLSSLTYNYETLKQKYGGATGALQVVTSKVTGIDAANKIVSLANGGALSYNRLVLAPGVDFDYSGISMTAVDTTMTAQQILDAVPHAWKAGPQTTTLRQQLAGMQNGAKFVLTIPKAPYRCPPGPYERACVIADWMKAKKPGSKVVILDANPKIMAEPVNFGAAFAGIHKSYIEYHPNIRLDSVEILDATHKRVTATDLTNAAAPVVLRDIAGVVNVIPPMRAGKIVIDTLGPGGLSADGRWALVNEVTYESTAFPGIHVIGDSISSKQPKAGHIGNQEAKVCADAILRLETGFAPFATPVTNSACFTPITTKAGPGGPTATWLTAIYRYNPSIDPATGKPFGMQMISGNPVGTASEPLKGPTGDNYDSMNKWFSALMQDVFA